MDPNMMRQMQAMQLQAAQQQALRQQQGQAGADPVLAMQQAQMMQQQAMQNAMAMQQQALQNAYGQQGGVPPNVFVGGGGGGIPQNSYAPAMVQPQVRGAGSSVRLPDGTVIEKLALEIAFVGPTGRSVCMSPCPVWKSPASRGQSAPILPPIEKRGSVWKLSKERTFLQGEKWQQRHLVLRETDLSYYASEMDLTPKYVIDLTTCECKVAQAGDPRLKNAFEPKAGTVALFGILTRPMSELTSLTEGTMSRSCVAVHKPVNAMGTLGAIQSMSGLALITGGAKKAVQDNKARTWYFACDSDSELAEWETAINRNIRAMGPSGPLATIMNYIRMVGGSAEGLDMESIFDQLYGYR